MVHFKHSRLLTNVVPLVHPYLMFTNVPLTFLIFIGSADPVPKKTTSGYFSDRPAEKRTVDIK